MKLLIKIFITLVIVGVISFYIWHALYLRKNALSYVEQYDYSTYNANVIDDE